MDVLRSKLWGLTFSHLLRVCVSSTRFACGSSTTASTTSTPSTMPTGSTRSTSRPGRTLQIQMFTHHLSYDPQVANPKWGDRLHRGGDDALRSSSTSGFVLHKSSEASFRNHQLYEYYFILKLKLVDAPKCESFFACQKTFTLFNWSLSNHIFEFPH